METRQRTVKKIITEFRDQLAGLYPEREVTRFLHLLFEHRLGWNRAHVHLSGETVLPATEIRYFRQTLGELAQGRPIQYILGEVIFDGFPLKVDMRVLIPRPETEEMCARIRRELASYGNCPERILDIGTGSGCIAVSMAGNFPHASVTALDRDTEALALAEENARLNRCQVTFRQADILAPGCLAGWGTFHLIVSNPPYVPRSEKQAMHMNVAGFEPQGALFVPDDDPLLYYKVIATLGSRHLEPGGWLFLEIHERFGRGVAEITVAAGLKEVHVSRDFQGRDRFVSARK